MSHQSRHSQTLPPIYVKVVGLPVIIVLTMGIFNTKLKLVWGVLAGTEDPQIQVLDNQPRYCC